MGTSNMTISLRADERAGIQQKMKETGMKQHEVVKLAIRRFLFPQEKKDIVVDGHVDLEPTFTIRS